MFFAAILADAQKNGDKSVYYEEVNWRRSRYAKENQIANMNFLDYDFGLEKFIIEELEKHDNCPNRTILIQRDNLKIFLNAHRDNEIEKETFVAGITKTARWTTRSEQCNNMEYGFHLALDLPKNPVVHGAPGSQCPEDREADTHGLCVIPGPQEIHWPFPVKFARKFHANNRKSFNLEDMATFVKDHPDVMKDVIKSTREFLKGELGKKKRRLEEIVARVKEDTRIAEELRQDIASMEKSLRSKRGFVEKKPSTFNHARRLHAKNRKPFSLGDIDYEKLRPVIDAAMKVMKEVVEDPKETLGRKKKELEEILADMKKGAEYVKELRKEIAGLEDYLKPKRG
ncbi:hypothetical protein CAEBREN_23415 [Caenorhabditis brenneri]|uniref:Uncharacterized protein n=1 Tax=Caenorhabditis brenneri TaxID=135651 RepID=G0PJ11_CAEBE|nr:hypothetical protein CAEBREN_23415 [Caenorhabditis brenneri]